ncbi:MAG: YvcK family protein [bacterium]|nr:YvcK family protein [bacterium]
MEPNIVVLGGGTGTVTVLSGLKQHDVALSAVVSMSDNGGSTGILRNEYGILPPGDIKQCLVALSDGDDLLRQMMTHRFVDGPLQGHTFGNVMLATAEQVCGSPLLGVQGLQRILRVRGNVIPVSSIASNLFAELEDGTVLEGEDAISQPASPRKPIRRCFLDPAVSANPEAINAIRKADLIIFGPGDLYSSLIPVLLVDGIAEAIAQSQAYRLLILNLTTKPGETDGYTATRFLSVVNQYLSPVALNGVVINSESPSKEVLGRYLKAGSSLVYDDLEDANIDVLRTSLVSEKIAQPIKGDILKRSLFRHDPERLANAILSTLTERKKT